MKKKNKHSDFFTNVICDECGYQNHKDNVDHYGTCRLCGKVLDAKAKFNYEMYCGLHLWKKKEGKNGRN